METCCHCVQVLEPLLLRLLIEQLLPYNLAVWVLQEHCYGCWQRGGIAWDGNKEEDGSKDILLRRRGT